MSWRQKRRPGIREKTSIGLACGRFHEGKPQLLFICKRYTYAFSTFAYGKYNSADDHRLIEIFSGMTAEEKLDILSLNFVQIWYRIWLNTPHRKSVFFIAKSKFENTFLTDGGTRLRQLITKATHSDRVWEMPKGKKNNKAEHDIHCAIREFYEETGLKKNTYTLHPRVCRRYSFIDEGVRYTFVYYFALMRHAVEPKIDFNIHDQVYEVADIRWMGPEEIKLVDPTGRLSEFTRPIFRYMRARCKK